MVRRHFLILGTVAFALACHLVSNIQKLGLWTLIFILVAITIDYAFDRRIRLIHVWMMAFVYVIVAELLANAENLNSHPYGVDAAQNLITANCILFIGYLVGTRHSYLQISPSTATVPFSRRNYATGWLLAALGAFFVFAIPIALGILTSGRSGELALRAIDDLLISGLMLSAGIVLPAVMKQFLDTYAKDWSAWKPFLYLCTAIIFVVFFAMGTRFYLLFCLGTFFVLVFRHVVTNGLNKRNVLRVLVILVVSGVLSNEITAYRGGGINSYKSFNDANLIDSSGSALTMIGNAMSPEGVVKLNADLIDYFAARDHLYGASSAFILYFWVPRALWPDKPDMIGYWIVREYESGFADGHSASVGFFGDFYADFGKLAFLAVFVLGVALAKVDKKVQELLVNNNSKYVVLAALTYPGVFFFVRSPITTVINVVGIHITYLILISLIFKKFR